MRLFALRATKLRASGNDEKLGENETFPRMLRFFRRGGCMHRAIRLAQIEVSVRLTQRTRQGILAGFIE